MIIFLLLLLFFFLQFLEIFILTENPLMKHNIFFNA